jgi:hypothetical protein
MGLVLFPVGSSSGRGPGTWLGNIRSRGKPMQGVTRSGRNGSTPKRSLVRRMLQRMPGEASASVPSKSKRQSS